jgi:hypothetical protein
LRGFPFVEKEMIRDVVETFSIHLPGRTYITTGGSTGIPFGMYRDQQSFPKEIAVPEADYPTPGKY